MGLGIGISGPNGSEPCDDANVVNSDGTYDVDVAAGGTLNLPDINNIDSDGSVVVTPAQTPFIATACSGGPVGATIMKTNQTVSYRTGDDGDIEAGRATDFLTLASNNPFGNTNRFTDILGTQFYSTSNIVIDWSTYDGATVLGYGGEYSNGGASGTNWDDAIDDALAYSNGTFTSGWRLPNIKELQNLEDYNLAYYPLDYYPFSLMGVQYRNLWSSTSVASGTHQGWYFEGTFGRTMYTAKTQTAIYSIPVRTFTVNGTTLT